MLSLDRQENYRHRCAELFPEAEHTIDVYHVTEYLWEAGECLYPEGSAELDEPLERLNPRQSNVRKRLERVRTYLDKRQAKMDYERLREQDLEISSGAVEGAVNYVIAKRFDSGGMRWIEERAEALLQLRCIEVNDDWETFITFVHDRTRAQARRERRNLSLKCTRSSPLPTYGLA